MKKLFSSRKTYIVLLTVTIISRLLFEINNPKLTSDHSIQTEAAKNFIKTGSFSHTWVTSEDLSEVKSNPLTMWPVGISFFLILFNLFTHNLIYSEICFQCAGILLFLFGCLKLFKYFNLNIFYINLFLLLYTFNCGPFYYLGSTDLFTGALFLWMVWLTLKETDNKQYNPINLFVLIILTFTVAIVRFACIPNLVIIPGYFVVMALLTKNKRFFAKGTIILIASCFLIMLFYHFFPIDSSRTGFIDKLKTGNLYYSNLKWFDAFPVKSLFFTRPIEFRLPHNSNVIFLFRVSLLITSFGFLAFLLSRFIKKLNVFNFIKQVKHESLNKTAPIMLLFLSACIIIIGFITLQTLTTPPESNSFGPSWMPPLWTFVYCTRYFIYLMFLIIVMYFIAYYQSEKESKATQKLFNGSYIIFLGWAFFYWLFINYQFYAPNGNGAGSEWVNEKTNITAFMHIKEIKQTGSNSHIVFAHHKDKMIEGLVTNFSEAYPTDDYTAIVNNNFKNSSPLILVMAMPNNLSEEEQVFLNTHKHNVLSVLKNEQLIRVDL